MPPSHAPPFSFFSRGRTANPASPCLGRITYARFGFRNQTHGTQSFGKFRRRGGVLHTPPQMSQNHNRLSFPIHPNNRIGHGKNYVRCRKNYIRHNSNYIRPFFTHSQHSEKQTFANKSPSRKILLKPNGLHLFSCFGQKLFNPRESPLRRRSQNPDHRKRKGR